MCLKFEILVFKHFYIPSIQVRWDCFCALHTDSKYMEVIDTCFVYGPHFLTLEKVTCFCIQDIYIQIEQSAEWPQETNGATLHTQQRILSMNKLLYSYEYISTLIKRKGVGLGNGIVCSMQKRAGFWEWNCLLYVVLLIPFTQKCFVLIFMKLDPANEGKYL